MGGVREKKGEKGETVKYIAERAALKKLQITSEQFRKLCVLKGVYPRQPKSQKLKGTNKTFYLVKDIKYLAHDPLINTFRDIKIYKRKLKHYKDKKNKEAMINLQLQEPTYSLDRIIKERYPTFEDALRDLDDALSHIYLFSRMPSGFKYPTNVQVRRCARLCNEWEHYVSEAKILRKTFVSIKGYYFQVDLNGTPVTYVVPHQGSFAQQKIGVGIKTMVFFLELYETLMGFVLYRLYTSLGYKYPPNLDHGRLESLLDIIPDTDDSMDTESKQTQLQKKTEERISTLDTKKLLEKEESNKSNDDSNVTNNSKDDDEFEKELKDLEKNEKNDLFTNMKFYLSREVPVSVLAFAIRSFGGQVSYDGPFGTYTETDESITHQVVDRDSQKHSYLGRSYVQPQWIFDCINEKVVLPTAEYGPSSVLPPHLSPFIEDQNEGYVPKRREVLDQIKEAIETGQPINLQPEYKYYQSKSINKEESDEERDDEEQEEEEVDEDALDEKNEDEVNEIVNEEEEEDEELTEQRQLENQYQKELQAEMEGQSFEQEKEKSNPKKKVKVDPEDEKRRLAEMMLSKKERGRYLFHVRKNKQKQRDNEDLMIKRKRMEQEKKGGKTKKQKADSDDDE